MTFQPGDRVMRCAPYPPPSPSLDSYRKFLKTKGTVRAVDFFYEASEQAVLVDWDGGDSSRLLSSDLRKLSPLEQLAEVVTDGC